MIHDKTASRASQAQVEKPRATIRFETLDSWRGICALLVAMMHFPASGLISESPFVRSAYLFVDYFFVLSGFVIAHGYGRKLSDGASYLRFIVLRLGRVYPLHVAVLAVFVGFEVLRLLVPALRGQGAEPFTDGNSLTHLLSSLALLNGIGLEDRLTWNGPSWSISAEVWTYMLFGIAVLLLRQRIWIALLVAIVAGPVILYAWSPEFMDTTYHLGLVRCVYGFALGALLYGLSWSSLHQPVKRAHSVVLWSVAELAAVVAVLAFVAVAGHKPLSLAAPFVFALVLAIFVHERGLVSRVLRTRLFLWLGTLSYGIYMVHIFVQARMINAGTVIGKMLGRDLVGPFDIKGEAFYGFGLNGAAFGTVMLLAMIVLVIFAAWIGNRLIERPFQRWSRRLVSAQGAAPSDANRRLAKVAFARAP